MKKEIQICIIGKIYNPNFRKLLKLNKCLEQYFKLVRFYIKEIEKQKTTSKVKLHNSTYEQVKQKYHLPSALTQSARDKAVEIYRSFRKNRKKNSKLKLKRISIRFDKRNYSFSKTISELTQYWLNLKLDRHKRVSLPIMFGNKQKETIEKVISNELKLANIEMVKKKVWYVHLVVKKIVEFEKPKTIIGLDIGENNLVVTNSNGKKGRFWKGSKLKQFRWKRSIIRQSLQKKNKKEILKRIGQREMRRTNQMLHIVANQVVEYVKQFEKPSVAMEDLTHIRKFVKFRKKMNRRLHTLPFKRLQNYIQYKLEWLGIPVVYVDPKNTSKTCHKCGRIDKRRKGLFECKCGLKYNSDLNASINIKNKALASFDALARGSCEPPITNESNTEKVNIH